MGTRDKNFWPEALLSWFGTHRRELPWREASLRDPYHVWIAEIMLQQTRTEAVRPYFSAWTERFPTIGALAAAEEADVLHAWQGLGYYSRARNIHKAAREIAAHFGGRMPEDITAIRGLPGIGDYTAGAVASIAFGARVPAVDGNVLRVFARLYALEEDILKTAAKKRVTQLAEEVIPAGRPGDFNEALMDLGAEVCIPKHPRCAACPLRPYCDACAAGREEELPHRAKKKPQKEEWAACGLRERDGVYLMHRRPARGMLANMWEFPMTLAADAEMARAALETLLGGAAEAHSWELVHVFTHRIWHMRAYKICGGAVPEGEWRWVTPAEMRKIPLAGPHARLAAIL